MEFRDKIGGAGTAADPIRNIGQIEYQGIEASAQYNLLAGANGESNDAPQLNVLLNLTLLNAEITRDASAARIGKAPQYAPDYSVRTGLIYLAAPQRKLALLAAFVDNSFADDANTSAR